MIHVKKKKNDSKTLNSIREKKNKHLRCTVVNSFIFLIKCTPFLNKHSMCSDFFKPLWNPSQRLWKETHLKRIIQLERGIRRTKTNLGQSEIKWKSSLEYRKHPVL